MNIVVILCLIFGFFLCGSMVFHLSYASSFFSTFGATGSGNNNLSVPTDVAISNDGKTIYVADSANNRIHLFDNLSKHLSVIGSSGTGDGQFDKPTVVKLDSSGNIFVADSQNNRIQKFDSSGSFKIKFGSADSSKNEYLDTPSGLAIQNSSGNVFVADYEKSSISVFDSSGKFKFKFGSLGQADGQFKNPVGLFIDNEDEKLYVADSGNNRIQVFKLVTASCPSETTKVIDGVCFVEKFGTLGTDNSKFNLPSGVALDTISDTLYVADSGNNRIQVFKLVTASCPSETTKVIDGVCFVEKFGTLGTDNSGLHSPYGLSLGSSNTLLYISDKDNDRIQVFKTSSVSQNIPAAPIDASITPISPQSLLLTWKSPGVNATSKITGYKIESKTGSEQFSVIVGDTKSTATYFVHNGVSSSNTYYYRISAINSQGTSSPSSTVSAKPQTTSSPIVLAVPISPNQVKLSWYPPSETYNQSITGYVIQREVVAGTIYDDIAEVGSTTTSYTVGNLTTDKEYAFVIIAKFSLGNSPPSKTVTAIPKTDSKEPSLSSSPLTIPSAPRDLSVTQISPTSSKLSWTVPASNGNSPIIGYKIEVKKGTGEFSVLTDDTKDTSTSYTDSGLVAGIQYTYKISAKNSVGFGPSSNEFSIIPTASLLKINTLEKFTTDVQSTLSFSATTTGATGNVIFRLDKNPPTGAQISETGKFSWTPTSSQGPGSYTFDIVAKDSSSEARTSVTITVNAQSKPITCNSDQELVNGNCIDKQPTCSSNQELVDGKCVDKEPEPPEIPAPFVDPNKDPQYYIDRYNNEPSYKDWFDTNYPEYSSIYEAVGVEPMKETKLAPFVDPNKDPQYYVDRYNNEPSYKDWFDTNYPDITIYEAVGVESPKEPEKQIGKCGEGTTLVNGICVLDDVSEKKGGGCLIATATYGTEMAPQVQQLRELRDNQLLKTSSGSAFMSSFNQFYYTFSPTIADWERENPAFREFVKISLTPMISSLSILNYVDMDSDTQVLGYGISLILLNVGMYFVAPGIVIYKVRKFL